MVRLRKAFQLVGFTALSLGVATPVVAHHPLDGVAMTTFAQGLLSGVGHPILGIDHLFFVIAVGIAAYLTGRTYSAPMVYMATMALGVGFVVSGFGMPFAEMAIALSLLGLGSMLAAGYSFGMRVIVPVFALAGLFHGSAFGGELAEQESVNSAVLVGYLLGLAGVQWLVAVGSGLAMRGFAAVTQRVATAARLSGAAIAAFGLILVIQEIKGAAFITSVIG